MFPSCDHKSLNAYCRITSWPQLWLMIPCKLYCSSFSIASWSQEPDSFHIPSKLTYVCSQKMDPQIFKLLETSYEAWVDSGIDVRALRDSNRVGVYTGICGSEVGNEGYKSPSSHAQLPTCHI